METNENLNSAQKSFLRKSLFPTNENTLKKAFYNGIALLLICICSVFAWGSFIILEPFLKPLFWALLCGSVLHPMKNKLSTHFKAWIIWLENRSTDFRLPIIFEVASCPIKLFLDLSEVTGELVRKNWRMIGISFCVICLSLIIYSYTPQLFVCLFWKVLNVLLASLSFILDLFESTTLVVTLLLGFLISLTILWNPKNEIYFLKASYAVWFALSAHVSCYFDVIRLPTFLILQFLFLVGYTIQNTVDMPTILKDDLKTDDGTFKGNILSDKGDLNEEQTKAADSETEISHGKCNQQASDNLKSALNEIVFFIGDNTSDIYIYWVSIACLVTLVLQSGWIPHCLVFLLLVYTLRHSCKYFGITDFITCKLNMFQSWLSEWYLIRKNVLIPAPISYLDSIFSAVKMRLLSWLKGSSDSAASVMVILALVFFVTFGSTFLVIQAYTEGMYMVKVGGSVINETVVHNPELTQLLPEGWEQTLDSVLNNAYTYGRQALSKLVRNMLSGVSEERIEELENRALEVWDRVYQAWMMSALEQKTTIGPKVTSSAVYQTWDHFLDAMHKTPELVSISALTQLAQNNMAMLTSGLESVWELIKGNASLLYSAFLTFFSLVFSHSFALFNFCLSMLVFLTALFYLLSSSRQLYKPVEVITAMSPVFGSRLALAMENAVKEVLTASFRLAVFYGMWTWLIHSLFQMNIVYIPSVLAAMLAVVPALGTYWACLPAALDLWLAQGKTLHAVTLAICQFLPTLFVDATIYTEINEGHPYLTGLAVAGGLFCMGMEGAIIGPLILCCLYVVVSMSSSIMQDVATPSAAQSKPKSSL